MLNCKSEYFIRFLSATLLLVVLLISTASALAQEGKQGATEHKELQQRIDFGNAQILGQSIKSGAVYLMHRKKSDIKNMLEVRQNYRNEIVEDYGLEKNRRPWPRHGRRRCPW